MRTPFLGAHAVARSKNLADQLCINLFPETVDSKDGKDVGALFMSPGLDLLTTIGAGPIRGATNMAGTLYAVSGAGVYSVTYSPGPGTYAGTRIGTIGTSTGPVSMINNGAAGQVALFDGSNGYLVESGALSTLSLPYSNPIMARYQDGFGVVNYANTNAVSQSNLNDLSTWSALNFATIAGNSDYVNGVGDIHLEMWFFKQTNTEVWINAGLSEFVFERLSGVYIEVGCVAPFSIAKAGETLLWLSQNDQGQGVVLQGIGYQPQRISTHAIEYAIAQYPVISDAIAHVYQQEGHIFYVLTFPTANATWVYDLATKLWHQRAAFLNGAFNRHWGNCFCQFNGLDVIGDYRNGNLYAYDMNTATDNGAQRKWVRSWRALPKPSMDPIRFNALQIDMQTGLGVPAGTLPSLSLSWSDDGGHTWSTPRIQPAAAIGATAQRVKFNRLGSTRRNHGLDRIFKLESSDQFGMALIGADLT